MIVNVNINNINIRLLYLPSRNVDVHECTCNRRCRGRNRWNPPRITNTIWKIKFIFHIVFVIHGGFHLFWPLQRLLHVHFIHIRCDPCAISSPCPLFKLEMHELKTLAELIHYYNSESLFLQGTIFGVPFRLLRQSSLCSFPSLILSKSGFIVGHYKKK